MTLLIAREERAVSDISDMYNIHEKVKNLYKS